MRPLLVVDLHGLPDHLARLLQVPRALQQELSLQDPVDPLCQGVLVAVVAIGHRALQAMAAMQLLIRMGAVLNATVRMMDQPLLRHASAQRHPQRLRHFLGLQARVHMPADDLARVRVGDQAQVHAFVHCGQVGDVGHP